jgi:hypothetical protein
MHDKLQSVVSTNLLKQLSLLGLLLDKIRFWEQITAPDFDGLGPFDADLIG